MPLQLSQRMFPAFFPRSASLPSVPSRHGARCWASPPSSLAELMLLNRLRARTRPDLTADTLARAAEVIGVTARHWWGQAGRRPVAGESAV